MVCVQRMLLSALPLLMACTVFGSTQEDMAERMLSSHDEMSMSGKGKGGKGKGVEHWTGKGKGDDYMSMDLSMSMSGSKSSKSSKKTKASKKDSKKSSKKGGGGEPGAPTGGPPSSPSEPATPSPTSANSIPIRATPYALFYDGDFTRIPSSDEFAAVADLTRTFLEEIMDDEFSQTSLTNLDDFLTFMIRNSFEFTEPIQGDYRCTGLFNPSSIFLPTVRELNSLIDDAFNDESLDEYVKRLQQLPSGNIFRTTTGVMKGLPDVPVPRSHDGSAGSNTFKMGLAATAAGIVVLAAGAAMLKRQRGEEQLEDPYSDNLKGDAATLAGETCTASLDGSSVWRKSSPYVTEDLDESEFEDEPLDDDEHETRSRPRGLAPPKAAFTS